MTANINVLHLFSNSKWTGPAEPVVDLCRTLRDQGVRIHFACTTTSEGQDNKVRAMARQYNLEEVHFISLSKHRHPLQNWRDIRALRKHLRNTPYELLHCHLDNDTEIALRARNNLGIPVIRSSYEGTGFSNDYRHRLFVSQCNAIIEPSQTAKHNDMRRFDAPDDKLFVARGAVDAERFNPDRRLPGLRARLGLSENMFVLGIVARIQAHRHYEDLFEAFSVFAKINPDAHLVIIGRGTRQDELAFTPVRTLDLDKQVHFTGYLDGDAYVGALADLDAGLFLTPGTDGTCRAVRELMAMGKPMITSSRGMLPEMVSHEESGLVTDGTPAQLLDAMRLLYEHPEVRRDYGNNARTAGKTTYGLARYAESVRAIYQKVLDAGPCQMNPRQ